MDKFDFGLIIIILLVVSAATGYYYLSLTGQICPSNSSSNYKGFQKSNAQSNGEYCMINSSNNSTKCGVTIENNQRYND